MKRFAKITVAAAILLAAGITIAHLISTPLGGRAYAQDLAAASKQAEEAKTATWKTMFYQRNSSKDSKEQLRLNGDIRRQKRLFAYKAPGLYRDVTQDDNGKVISIDINDTVQKRRLLLDAKEKKATLFSQTEPMFDPRGPFVWVLEELRREDLKWLGKKEVAGRDTNGFRHSFWYERGNEKYSYDFWVDAQTKRLVAYQVPGVDILDPERLYKEPTLGVGASGHFVHDIVFGVNLDDSLFSLEPPEGYAIEVVGSPKVSEKDVIEFLGIVAEYFGKAFPDQVPQFLHGPETDRYLKVEAKPMEERTAAENRMVEAMHMSLDIPGPGPMILFMQQNIVEGSWKYVGDGVKLGDKSRIVCWYRPKGSKTYRVVYGDLSVKDIAAEDLPLAVDP